MSGNCHNGYRKASYFCSMKLVFSFSVVLIIIMACNDPGKEEVSSSAGGSKNPEQELKDKIAKNPDSLQFITSLIGYYQSQGKDSLALSTTESALQKNAAYPDFWAKKAWISMRLEDTASAVNAFEKLLMLNPQADYLKALGDIYAAQGNRKALMLADSLVINGNTTDRNDGMLIKGMYFGNINQKKLAEKIFDTIIFKSPGYGLAYREKALLLYDEDRYEEAIKLLQRITTLDNSFIDGYLLMAQCYEELDKKDEAIANYQKVLLYEKDNRDAIDALQRLGVR